MVFEVLESVFNALTKWSEAPNPPAPEGPFASVDERKNREEEPEDQD
ncbi:hypothetical protein [Saccharothrix xinjiangensis]|uniref:Uncharacterized protein n=1 Tax=Saccharothrix xinjiangensis TaxID=204798 RepID=A0ABV9Y1D5_9PSEU